MAVETQKEPEDASARLIAAGRSLLARGDARFSLARLCAEAGVSLPEFRTCFANKAALLQRLMEIPKPAPQLTEVPRPKPESVPAATSAPPPLPQADAWLERRLRVFERALQALEERAEKDHREQALAIVRLEEKLAVAQAVPRAVPVQAAPVLAAAMPGPVLEDEPADEFVSAEPERAPEPSPVVEEDAPAKYQPVFLAPLEPEPMPVADTDFLETARRAAQERAREMEKVPPRRVPLRLLVVAGLAVFTLLVCAGLTLVQAARPRLAAGVAGQGVAHRVVATAPLARLMARADSGDVQAQVALAFAYLRGEGLGRDQTAAARWSDAAARRGDAGAQYLIGSLTLDGAGVGRDPARAFQWFGRAAAAGNLKAMHNLAIAYAEGRGTTKDEAAAAAWFARAAARGYVNSAFDLAVLYERGAGVRQSAKEALRWYRIAAQAGDGPAAARAHILETQAHL